VPLAHRQAADGVAVEADVLQALRGLATRILECRRPDWMPNSTCLSRVPNAALERSPQRADSSMPSRARFSSAGQATHSSSCIWMSLPSRSAWISIDRSGRARAEPSIWLAKVTAFSVTLLIPDSDITWKPPLSVRIGLSQRMNL
jgi:hypothetical protein